jgi:hypothetical protein
MKLGTSVRDTFVESIDFHYASGTVREVAHYFVACHRAKLTVYANSPIGKGLQSVHLQ